MKVCSFRVLQNILTTKTPDDFEPIEGAKGGTIETCLLPWRGSSAHPQNHMLSLAAHVGPGLLYIGELTPLYGKWLGGPL